MSRTNNPVAAFLEERCQIDAEASVTKNQLYEAYKDWCEDQGLRSVLAKNRFLAAAYAACNGQARAYHPGPRQADREPRVKGLALAELPELPF